LGQQRVVRLLDGPQYDVLPMDGGHLDGSTPSTLVLTVAAMGRSLGGGAMPVAQGTTSTGAAAPLWAKSGAPASRPGPLPVAGLARVPAKGPAGWRPRPAARGTPRRTA